MATTRKPSKSTAAGKSAGLKTAADKTGKRPAPASTRMTPQTSARTSGASKPAASKVAAKKAVVAKKTTNATTATKVIPKKAVAQTSTGTRKPAPAAAPGKTTSAKPSPKPASPKPASSKPASAKPAAAAKPTKPKAASQSKMITADQALANTRALLQAKQAQAHQPTPYPTSDPGHHAHGGFMSHNAAETNQERHFDEANSPAIQGHVAAQVRSEQGKRDKR